MSDDEREVALARAEEALRRLSGICRLQKTCHPDVFCSTLPQHWRSNKSLPTPFVVLALFPIRDGTKVTVAAGNDENFCADVKNNVAEMNGQVARFSDLRFVGKSGRGKNFNLSITLHTSPVPELIVVPNVIKVTVDGPRDSRNASKYLNGEYVPRKRQPATPGLIGHAFGQPAQHFFGPGPSTSSMVPRPFYPGIMPLLPTNNSSTAILAQNFVASSTMNLMARNQLLTTVPSSSIGQSKARASANTNMPLPIIPPAHFFNNARMNPFAAALASLRPSAFATPTPQTSMTPVLNEPANRANSFLRSNPAALLSSPLFRLPPPSQVLNGGVQASQNPALNFLAVAAATAPFFALSAQSQALLATMSAMASAASGTKENDIKSAKSEAAGMDGVNNKGILNEPQILKIAKPEHANATTVTLPQFLGLQNARNTTPTAHLDVTSKGRVGKEATVGDNCTSFEDLTPSPTSNDDGDKFSRDKLDQMNKFLARTRADKHDDDNDEREMEDTSNTASIQRNRKRPTDCNFTTTALSADSVAAPFSLNNVDYVVKRRKLLAELVERSAIVAATSTHQRSSGSDVWRPFN